MSDATGLAEAMLGLDGFRVLAVEETVAELVIHVETTPSLVGCLVCGVQAVAHERMVVELRDLPAFGRPARLVWAKRRWRCEEPLCEAKTWTETSPWFSARCVLSNRAAIEACRQVGRNARPVAQLADEMGVCWHTVMEAVREYGQPLVDDPDRVGEVRMLGVDETAFLKATRDHSTLYATGLVDLDERIVIDVIEGNTVSSTGRRNTACPGSVDDCFWLFESKWKVVVVGAVVMWAGPQGPSKRREAARHLHSLFAAAVAARWSCVWGSSSGGGRSLPRDGLLFDLE